jgi:hypothetical protein
MSSFWAKLSALFRKEPSPASVDFMPANFPYNGPCAVMCCTCRRLMAPDGSTVSTASGSIDWSKCANFPNSKAADAAAAGFGWQISDQFGSNHRCPDCIEAKRESRWRGAHVRWGEPIGAPE